MENHQLIMVIDFGGQYNHLIARRVRECGVYCEVKPYTVSIEEIKQKNPIGIIFTGGPNSVYVKDAPRIDPALYQLGIPILGICYGIQLIAQELGGHVTSPDRREYGRTETTRRPVESLLFGDQPDHFISWMSHTDYIDRLPEGFVATAATLLLPDGGDGKSDAEDLRPADASRGQSHRGRHRPASQLPLQYLRRRPATGR